MNPVGLELELLAPVGNNRDDLARALARDFGGALRFGTSYHGEGHLPDGHPDCRLTPASRVDVKGAWFASFVDDPTIRDDLLDPTPQRRVARTDDVRLAAFIERSCWSASPRKVFAALQKTFSTHETDEGLYDPWGQPLVLWHHEPAERQRVCEVVLRPLSTRERGPVLKKVMARARSLGFTVPLEAAVHLHVDAAPFRSARALRRLVSEWNDSWRARFEPNSRCRKLGPFTPTMQRVVNTSVDDDDFQTIAVGLLLAGLHRSMDINLLGLLERAPKHPTVELRCLPGSLDAHATLERMALADAFFAHVLAT